MANAFEKFFGKDEVPTEPEDGTIRKDDKRVIGKIIGVSGEGYGFISSKDIKFTRIFFHWTSLKQDTLPFLDLKIGMKVEFTPVQIEGKGWRAIKIKVVDDIGTGPIPGGVPK